MNSNLNRMDVQSVSSVIYQWIFLSGRGKKKNKESSVYLFDLFIFLKIQNVFDSNFKKCL